MRRLFFVLIILASVTLAFIGMVFFGDKITEKVDIVATGIERIYARLSEPRRPRVSVEYDFDAAGAMTCRVNGESVPVTGTPGSSEQEADIGKEIDSRIFLARGRRVLPIVQEITRVDESARWAPVIGSMCCNFPRTNDPWRVIFHDSSGKVTQEHILNLAGGSTGNDLWAEAFADVEEPGRFVVAFRRGDSECGELEATENDLPKTIAAFVQTERAAGRLPLHEGAQVILHVPDTTTAKDASRHLLMMKIPEVHGITWYFDNDADEDMPPGNKSSVDKEKSRWKRSAGAPSQASRNPENSPPPR